MARPVALTFDDGPDPVWTPRVLDALDRAGAKATFFVLAGRAAAHPELLDRIAVAGHEIGFHGNLHLRHDEYAPAVIETDTEEGLKLLAAHPPRLWRPPHGIVTPATEELARRHGLRLVHWTADSVDWQAGETAGSILGRLEPQLSAGSIVLMHDAVGPGALRADPAPTVEAIAPLVQAIRARSLEPGLIDRQPEKSRIWARVTSRMSRASR